MTDEELDRLLDVPFTFDMLRDPDWGPSREDYRDMRDGLHAEIKRLRVENFALVDAMRDARALLHQTRPRAMAAALLLGDALTSRALAMLPEEGKDDCSECDPVGGDADCPRCNP